MPGKAENGKEIVGNDFKQPQAGPQGEAPRCAEWQAH
jgi:hypothetical protein